MSITSRQYRAKRITVNVKVNALSYVVEMLGGVIIAALSFLRHAHILYTIGMIWYGSVIPSCYLINFSDTKNSIIDEGWAAGLSKLYKKKEPVKPGESNQRTMKEKRQRARQIDLNQDSPSNNNREMSIEQNSGETRNETESENVTDSVSTINDDTAPILSTKKHRIKEDNEREEKLRMNNTGIEKFMTCQDTQIILYDLEDTNSPRNSKFIENNKKERCSKCINCTAYHIS